MQGLPPEMLSAIASMDPEVVLALGRTGATMRSAMTSLFPVLEIGEGQTVEWNAFATSPYGRVRGKGYLGMPADDRLVRASRRVQGDLPLALSDEETLPRDVFQCLRVRALLYPESAFHVAYRDGTTIVEWKKERLTLNLSIIDWESLERPLLDVVTMVPVRSLDVDYRPEGSISENLRRFASILENLLEYVNGLEMMIFQVPTYVALPASVHTIGIPGTLYEGSERIGDQPVRSYEQPITHIYDHVTRLVILRYHGEAFPRLDSFRRRFIGVIERLPNLRSVVYELDTEYLVKGETPETIREKVQDLQNLYPEITFEVIVR